MPGPINKTAAGEKTGDVINVVVIIIMQCYIRNTVRLIKKKEKKTSRINNIFIVHAFVSLFAVALSVVDKSTPPRYTITTTYANNAILFIFLIFFLSFPPLRLKIKNRREQHDRFESLTYQ